MAKKGKVLRKLSDVAVATTSFNTAPLKEAFRKFLPQRQRKPRFECQFCCEHKRLDHFIARAAIPYSCQLHIATTTNRVCKTCMEASLSAQLDCKPLLDVGCPQCGVGWEPEELRYLIGWKNEKRFKELDRLAREQILVPSDLPDGATVDVLLAKGARFWCVLHDDQTFVRTSTDSLH